MASATSVSRLRQPVPSVPPGQLHSFDNVGTDTSLQPVSGDVLDGITLFEEEHDDAEMWRLKEQLQNLLEKAPNTSSEAQQARQAAMQTASELKHTQIQLAEAAAAAEEMKRMELELEQLQKEDAWLPAFGSLKQATAAAATGASVQLSPAVALAAPLQGLAGSPVFSSGGRGVDSPLGSAGAPPPTSSLAQDPQHPTSDQVDRHEAEFPVISVPLPPSVDMGGGSPHKQGAFFVPDHLFVPSSERAATAHALSAAPHGCSSWLTSLDEHLTAHGAVVSLPPLDTPGLVRAALPDVSVLKDVFTSVNALDSVPKYVPRPAASTEQTPPSQQHEDEGGIAERLWPWAVDTAQLIPANSCVALHIMVRGGNIGLEFGDLPPALCSAAAVLTHGDDKGNASARVGSQSSLSSPQAASVAPSGMVDSSVQLHANQSAPPPLFSEGGGARAGHLFVTTVSKRSLLADCVLPGAPLVAVQGVPLVGMSQQSALHALKVVLTRASIDCPQVLTMAVSPTARWLIHQRAQAEQEVEQLKGRVARASKGQLHVTPPRQIGGGVHGQNDSPTDSPLHWNPAGNYVLRTPLPAAMHQVVSAEGGRRRRPLRASVGGGGSIGAQSAFADLQAASLAAQQAVERAATGTGRGGKRSGVFVDAVMRELHAKGEHRAAIREEQANARALRIEFKRQQLIAQRSKGDLSWYGTPLGDMAPPPLVTSGLRRRRRLQPKRSPAGRSRRGQRQDQAGAGAAPASTPVSGDFPLIEWHFKPRRGAQMQRCMRFLNAGTAKSESATTAASDIPRSATVALYDGWQGGRSQNEGGYDSGPDGGEGGVQGLHASLSPIEPANASTGTVGKPPLYPLDGPFSEQLCLTVSLPRRLGVVVHCGSGQVQGVLPDSPLRGVVFPGDLLDGVGAIRLGGLGSEIKGGLLEALGASGSNTPLLTLLPPPHENHPASVVTPVTEQAMAGVGGASGCGVRGGPTAAARTAGSPSRQHTRPTSRHSSQAGLNRTPTKPLSLRRREGGGHSSPSRGPSSASRGPGADSNERKGVSSIARLNLSGLSNLSDAEAEQGDGSPGTPQRPREETPPSAPPARATVLSGPRVTLKLPLMLTFVRPADSPFCMLQHAVKVTVDDGTLPYYWHINPWQVQLGGGKVATQVATRQQLFHGTVSDHVSVVQSADTSGLTPMEQDQTQGGAWGGTSPPVTPGSTPSQNAAGAPASSEMPPIFTPCPCPSQPEARAAFLEANAKYFLPMPWAHIREAVKQANAATPILSFNQEHGAPKQPVGAPGGSPTAAGGGQDANTEAPPQTGGGMLPPPRPPQATPPRPPTLAKSHPPPPGAVLTTTVRFTSVPLGIRMQVRLVTHIGHRSEAWGLLKEGAQIISVGGVPVLGMKASTLASELKSGASALRKHALGMSDERGILDAEGAFVLQFRNPPAAPKFNKDTEQCKPLIKPKSSEQLGIVTESPSS